ncbi:MAG TPA: hypothetical protein VKG26_09525, partial [Bacteroidia bacterium]|nr:hypothetical protein [Bacteroidia bacterium]
KTEGLENKVCSMPYYYVIDNNEPIVDNKEFEAIDFLTTEEKEKYKKLFNTDGQRIYVPLSKLQKADELDGMFHYLIISK